MSDKATILAVDDTSESLALLARILTEAGYQVRPADSGELALIAVAANPPDLILLDIHLPGIERLEVCRRLKTRDETQRIPIIFISASADRKQLVEGLQLGAADYITKPFNSEELLARVKTHLDLSRANILLQQQADELRALSLNDELTGLRNRRGFLTLAEQELKTAQRTRRGMFLLFMDLDVMKEINDTLGHSEGDAVLVETAQLLRETFHESDILARLGGDEFAVLAMETAEESSDIPITRLQTNLTAHNARQNRSYPLSLSVGSVRYDPDAPCSIEELLTRADELMYEDKWRKRQP